jgi:predicted amino acid-binding ACT domain protein
LGNDRPKIVTQIEKIIWEEIMDIANGSQTVHDAAANIVERTPETYDHFDEDMRRWFMLCTLRYLDL